MLTGLIAPTSGGALIYGYNMSDPCELEEARRTIGFCPQQNVLFDDFTVLEHLVFFARLKGASKDIAMASARRIIDEIGMQDKMDVQAKQLSGGQKRRLSIAIAVLGSPKVLILDEPSSGVDIYSQRSLWDMIRKFRENRCVIIATQSMEEADVLADRKMIISHGKSRCAGTSLFLKNRFGSGYYLTTVITDDCDEDAVTELVSSQVSGAERTRSRAGELRYMLPASAIKNFVNLFGVLDEKLHELGIESFGISLSTIEDVFLKLAAEY